jgi:hypothetical protein
VVEPVFSIADLIFPGVARIQTLTINRIADLIFPGVAHIRTSTINQSASQSPVSIKRHARNSRHTHRRRWSDTPPGVGLDQPLPPSCRLEEDEEDVECH